MMDIFGMRCDEAQELFLEYYTKGIDLGGHPVLREHIITCMSCVAAVVKIQSRINTEFHERLGPVGSQGPTDFGYLRHTVFCKKCFVTEIKVHGSYLP